MLSNAECVGAKTRAVRDDPRKDVPSYHSGGETRLHHSTRRASAIAARELEIPWETARTQLKSVFAKTYTHRQSELVALLLQVE